MALLWSNNPAVKGKVLVVDDEVEICKLLTQYLKKLDYEASYALSIRQAVQNLSDFSYDLLFVDLNLRDGSGYDLIKIMKDLCYPSKIIVISAYDGEQHKALQMGANLFLAKPFTKQLLEESLQKLNFLTK